jgi:hypothetical protein
MTYAYDEMKTVGNIALCFHRTSHRIVMSLREIIVHPTNKLCSRSTNPKAK